MINIANPLIDLLLKQVFKYFDKIAVNRDKMNVCPL